MMIEPQSRIMRDRAEMAGSPARRPRPWLLLPGGMLAAGLLAVAAGIAYEQIASASDGRRYPPPGDLVDVGGRRLHLRCMGQGSPSVILEAGKGEYSLVWDLVQPELARYTRVCAYDRAGLGWSELSGQQPSPRQAAADLQALLSSAQIAPPYVLVGHSLGSKIIRLFAEQHPGDVAGMVLVDGYHEAWEKRIGPAAVQQYVAREESKYRLAQALGQLGIARLLGPEILAALDPDYARFPRRLRTALMVFMSRAEAVEVEIAELRLMGVANDRLASAASLGHKPLIVLAHSRPWPDAPQEQAWQESQAWAASLSTQGRLQVVADSGHSIMIARPDAVIEAVRQVLREARPAAG